MPYNWHNRHLDARSASDRIADNVATAVGSWSFIIFANIGVLGWVALNLAGWFYHWDVYPFILLNLVFSWAAFNSTPIIMMSQNRAAQRDRAAAEHDYKVNEEALTILHNQDQALANQDLMIKSLRELLSKGVNNGNI
jgi:uncharacterized membrane protein